MPLLPFVIVAQHVGGTTGARHIPVGGCVDVTILLTIPTHLRLRLTHGMSIRGVL